MAGLEGAIEGVDAQGTPGLFSYQSLASANWLPAANYPLAEAMALVGANERRMWQISAGLALMLAP